MNSTLLEQLTLAKNQKSQLHRPPLLQMSCPDLYQFVIF